MELPDVRPGSDPRDVLEKAPWGSLQQGTIFNGAQADGYEGCDVYGLIITAHCDLAQDKTPVVNYVPIVRVDDWLVRDGARVLARRYRADIEGKIKGFVEQQLRLSPTLLTVHSLREIVEVYLRDAPKPKGVETIRERGEELSAHSSLCDAVELGVPSALVDIQRLIATKPKTYEKVVAELMTQHLTGYYFLSAIELTTEQPGFVVLLRQIYHLPAAVARGVSRGLGREEFIRMADAHPRLGSVLCMEVVDFALPVAQMRSPYLEHLMQAFGMLYMRIGVQDLSGTYMGELAKRLGGQK